MCVGARAAAVEDRYARAATRSTPNSNRRNSSVTAYRRCGRGSSANAQPNSNRRTSSSVPTATGTCGDADGRIRFGDAHRIPQNSTRQPPAGRAHSRTHERPAASDRPKSKPHGSPPARGAHKPAAVHARAHGERHCQCANSERVGAAASSSTRSSNQVNWSAPPKTFRLTHP